jgi:hypothetical protein
VNTRSWRRLPLRAPLRFFFKVVANLMETSSAD